MMRITVDCFKLEKGLGKSIGIYVYAQSMLKGLVEQSKGRFDICVLGNAQNREDFAIEGVSFVEIPYDHHNKINCVLWELIGVKKYIRETACDKVFFPRGYIPLGKSQKTVVTIHDMIPFYYHEKYPDVLGKIENFYIMKRLKASARNAATVFTISEGAKEQICKYSGVQAEHIQAIHSGMVEKVEPVGEEIVPNITQSPYIMAITSKLPHKNPEGILRAYMAYWKQTEEPQKIFIAGMKNPRQYVPELPEEIEQDIICGKYLDDQAFYTVMHRASCLLFLSRIEGLGYPPLEAMQQGVPVIVSDIPVMREIVSDAGLYVPLEDAEAAGEQIKSLLADEKLQKQLVQKGYENIKRFEWQNQIKKYIEVLLRT